MYRLYHHPICPFSRQIRLLLAAKDIGFELVKENFWERRREFIAMNPAGKLPVLFDNTSIIPVSSTSVIIEYIEEKHKESNSYIGEGLGRKAEARRIQVWFDNKFYNEVGKYILDERFYNRYLPEKKYPDSEILRKARKNLLVHLKYIEYLLESRKYLAGDYISIADFAAASHLSSIDYFGDINWNLYLSVKDWYSVVKSHKFFMEILKDRIVNIDPPEHYSKLDF